MRIESMARQAPLWPYFLLYFPQILFPHPSGLDPVAGVEVIEQGSLLEIRVPDKAILRWDSFSVGDGETARFILPGTKSSVLNRVAGGSPSEILGSLESNGSVYLINPNGILFGENSKLHVANLVASTLNISDEDFFAGIPRFEGTSSKSIANYGEIQAEQDLILAAVEVENFGKLRAQSVYLAAGSEVLLDKAGRQRLIVSRSYVDNPYESAIGAGGSFSGAEEIILDAGRGQLSVTGEIVSRNIQLLGDNIHLHETAWIDASSETLAGTVLVGGDYKGMNGDIPNAKNVWMHPEAQIAASALYEGNGGKVILWGEESCLFYGTILAEGGPVRGDGGFIETSSPKRLHSSGTISTFAPNGQIGTYLMDPCAVTVNSVAYSGIATFPPPSFTFSGATANVSTTSATTLLTYLNASNVTIDANTGTGGAASIDFLASLNWTSANQLTLNAPGGTVTINNVALTGNSSGKVLINANQTNITSAGANAGITVSGATGQVVVNSNLTLQAGISAGTTANAFIDSNNNSSTITVNGTVAINGGTSGALDARAYLESNGPILINGDVFLTGGNGAGAGEAYARINGNNVGTVTINGNLNCQGGTSVAGGAEAYVSGTTGDLRITGNVTATGGISNTASNVTSDSGILMNGTGAGMGADVTIEGNVNLYGGVASISGQANGTIQTEKSGDINLEGNVYLEGGVAGVGGQTRAVISAREAAVLNIIGGNSITLIGGTGAGGSPAQIHTADPPGSGVINIDISGPITMIGNPTAAVGTHEAHINAEEGGPINIRCASLTMTAGLSTASNAEITTIPPGGPISIITGPIVMTAQTSDALISADDGSVSISAGPIQLLGGTASTGAAQISTTGVGNISIGCSSLNLIAGTSGGTATTADVVTQTGDIFINASGPINIVGGNHSMSEANIQSRVSGDITIGCGSLVMTGGSAVTTNASITTQSGDIFIHSLSNAALSATLANAPANIQTFGSNLTLIADDNISLAGFSTLSTPASGGNLLAIAGNDFSVGAQSTIIVNGAGELTLVCDNDFPTPFGFGPGQFVLTPGGTIRNLGGGPVRIFTVSPIQNSFTPPTPATINNFPFFPSGLTFVDVPPYEYWCTYYDPAAGAVPPFSGSGIGGFEFTVFYKLCEQTLAVIATPQEEFLFDLNTFDTYFDKFYVQFNFDSAKLDPAFPTLDPPVRGNTFRRQLYFENVGRNPEPELMDNMPFIARNEEIEKEYE